MSRVLVSRRRMARSHRLLATSADCRRPVGALHAKPSGGHVAEEAEQDPNRSPVAIALLAHLVQYRSIQDFRFTKWYYKK
jgi:hypothetical protein